MLKSKEIAEQIVKQRVDVMTAFLAKYGCEPEAIEQVEEKTETGFRWCVRLKEATDSSSLSRIYLNDLQRQLYNMQTELEVIASNLARIRMELNGGHT